MHKRNCLLAVLVVVLSIVTLSVTSSYIKNQRLIAARHHLLCEVLKPGMSEDEVLRILSQAGEFTLRRSDWSERDVELGINFIDPRGKELYGGFELRFFDNEYSQAYISNFDAFDIICDFTRTIESSTATSFP